MSSAHQAVPEQARAGAGPGWRRRSARSRQVHEAQGQALPMLRFSLWLGLITGLAELGLTLAQKPLTDPSPGFFRMNRHIVWTIPTVNLALFGVCGIVAALGLRALPRLGTRWVIGPLVFLATLTVLLSFRWLHRAGLPADRTPDRDQADEANRRAIFPRSRVWWGAACRPSGWPSSA